MKLYDKIMNRGLYEVNEDSYFAWQGCDVCAERTGKRLGGTVHDAYGYQSLKDATEKPDNYYDFRICGMCLNAYANGEDFDD